MGGQDRALDAGHDRGHVDDVRPAAVVEPDLDEVAGHGSGHGSELGAGLGRGHVLAGRRVEPGPAGGGHDGRPPLVVHPDPRGPRVDVGERARPGRRAGPDGGRHQARPAAVVGDEVEEQRRRHGHRAAEVLRHLAHERAGPVVPHGHRTGTDEGRAVLPAHDDGLVSQGRRPLAAGEGAAPDVGEQHPPRGQVDRVGAGRLPGDEHDVVPGAPQPPALHRPRLDERAVEVHREAVERAQAGVLARDLHLGRHHPRRQTRGGGTGDEGPCTAAGSPGSYRRLPRPQGWRGHVLVGLVVPHDLVLDPPPRPCAHLGLLLLPPDPIRPQGRGARQSPARCSGTGPQGRPARPQP
ncbi:hypothetical protein SAMN05421867_111133 [Cellulomonas marina]|uniref:Uncharacterized protein n=1 Tax=Cellulomonas marina TaxID=988821 RepID=A0A1I0ZJG7_9CELL|nr:hypothetical protein SAMN05421867_111133 [Cellulomonas marina]